MNKKLTLCLLLALKCSAPAQTNSFAWPSVALSGANAIVTGVYTLPGSPNNVWIRTDVGGVYSYNSADGTWKPLTDTFTLDNVDYYSCDGFAVNPLDMRIMYYAGGRNDDYNGAILKSIDSGQNWSKLPVPLQDDLMVPHTINGNGDNRYAGERLAVSPTMPKYVLYGSRRTGLWYSGDSGAHWTRTSVPVTDADLGSDEYYGVMCVAFDPKMEGRAYCAASLHGVYSSNDYGATWTYLRGTGTVTSSSRPQRLKVAPNGTATTPGTVWYTTGNNIGDPTGNSVQKFEGGAWTTLYPGNSADGIYCGLAINPNNYKEVIVQQGSQGPAMCRLLRTTNNGVGAWDKIDYGQDVYTDASKPNPNLPTQAHWYGHPSVHRFSPSDLAFDPMGSPRLWGGQWYCEDITLKPYVTWTQREFNHEENVMRCLVCPPYIDKSLKNYELLEGSMDDRGLGWTSTSLPTIPEYTLTSTPWEQDIKRIAFCEHSPRNMMRTGSQHRYGQSSLVVARSTDGGDTWKQVDFPPDLLPMDLAVTSDTDATTLLNAVVVCHPKHTSNPDGLYWYETVPGTNHDYTVNSQNTAQVYTYDSTKKTWSWQTAIAQTYSKDTAKWSAVPWPNLLNIDPRLAPQVLASDRINGSYFYYLSMTAASSNPPAAQVYTSSDHGLTFRLLAPDTLPAGKVSIPGGMAQYTLKSQPGAEGNVWVAVDKYPDTNRNVDKEGLYHSADYGRTFSKLDNVNRALSFGFGKAEDGAAIPVILYMYGRISSNPLFDGMYYSTDLGAHWTSMASTTNCLGNAPTIIEGSRQTPKRVFVGTQGRGIYYSK